MSQAERASVLGWILGAGCQWAQINLRTEDGKKLGLPTRVRGVDDLHGLVLGHLSGAICREVECSDGRKWMEDRATTVSAGPLIEHDGQAFARWICIDVDGADHAGGDDARAQSLARDAWAACDEAGLAPVLERSHGGRGWHVWCLLRRPIEAEFAWWLGLVIRNAIGDESARARLRDDIAPGIAPVSESFPKGVTYPGNRVALPWPGRPRVAGGGQPEITAAEWLARRAEPAALERLRPRWQAWTQALAEVRWERRSGRPALRHEELDRGATDLWKIAQALGQVNDQQSDRRHLVLTCPHHASKGGGAFRVSLPKQAHPYGVWKCFACGQGGGGDSAPYTLARWLLGGAGRVEPIEVWEALRRIERGGYRNV